MPHFEPISSLRQADGVAALAAQVITPAGAAGDASILTYTTPADVPNIGTVLRFVAQGNTDNGTTAGTLNVWIKNNAGTKIGTMSFTTTVTAKTLAPWRMEFLLTYRASGATGAVILAGSGIASGAYAGTTAVTFANILNGFPLLTQTATTAQATNVGHTWSIGMNWTAGVATNIGRCDHAVIEIAKL